MKEFGIRKLANTNTPNIAIDGRKVLRVVRSELDGSVDLIHEIGAEADPAFFISQRSFIEFASCRVSKSY